MARNLTGHIAIPFEIAFAPTRSESDSVTLVAIPPRSVTSISSRTLRADVRRITDRPAFALAVRSRWRGLADVK
jgi:hypothetical protein